MTIIEMEVLPPVRKNVFRHSLSIVAVYVIVGIFMMIAVFLASGTTPKAIHLNYDSIAAANQMQEAWSALSSPEKYQEKSQEAWTTQFENALQFEEKNITEIGESAVASELRATWEKARKSLPPENSIFLKVRYDLATLTRLNEKGMFGWVERSHVFSREVFVATVISFIFTIFIALYLADSLAVKIATPMRDLTAVLKQRLDPGSPLKLPKAETLEMGILSKSLLELWERINYFQTLNLDEISSQRRKLEAVLTSVEDAVLVLDAEDKIIQFNPGFLSVINLSAAALIGKFWHDLPLASENYLALRSSLTPNAAKDQTIELEVGQKRRTFAARHRKILDERNESIGNLYLLHDITETRQRDIIRAEFIGVLSHELKTPLQSLGTASELLSGRKEGFNDDEKMLIETIAEDTHRIKNVVNEFIDVGVSDVHSLRLKLETVPIQKLICQWTQTIQVLARERSVKVEIGATVTDEILVKIDKIKFSWAITNLLSNALRVSEAGASVLVSTLLIDGKIAVDIADHGPGIAPEVQRRMFEPYFQAATKDGVKTSGFLGLGLTICRDLVEAHDGRIEYRANVPQGSIFRITLPVVVG